MILTDILFPHLARLLCREVREKCLEKSGKVREFYLSCICISLSAHSPSLPPSAPPPPALIPPLRPLLLPATLIPSSAPPPPPSGMLIKFNVDNRIIISNFPDVHFENRREMGGLRSWQGTRPHTVCN